MFIKELGLFFNFTSSLAIPFCSAEVGTVDFLTASVAPPVTAEPTLSLAAATPFASP